MVSSIVEAADAMRAAATRHGKSREDLLSALEKTLYMEDNPRGLSRFEKRIFEIEEEILPPVPTNSILDQTLMELTAAIHGA
jgi:hypothetical protein